MLFGEIDCREGLLLAVQKLKVKSGWKLKGAMTKIRV
jgi:hypothetical protein